MIVFDYLIEVRFLFLVGLRCFFRFLGFFWRVIFGEICVFRLFF